MVLLGVLRQNKKKYTQKEKTIYMKVIFMHSKQWDLSHLTFPKSKHVLPIYVSFPIYYCYKNT